MDIIATAVVLKIGVLVHRKIEKLVWSVKMN